MHKQNALALFILIAMSLAAQQASAHAIGSKQPKYKIIDIGSLGGPKSVGTSVNDAGEVAGFSDIATPVQLRSKTEGMLSHAFLWKNGKIEDLDAGTDTSVSGAQSINDAGMCVGSAYSGGPSPGFPCLWKDGHRQPLGKLQGGNGNGLAVGINDKGQICGWSNVPVIGDMHAFFWQKER